MARDAGDRSQSQAGATADADDGVGGHPPEAEALADRPLSPDLPLSCQGLRGDAPTRSGARTSPTCRCAGDFSKAIYQDDQIKAAVFGIGQGQELSEHTAAKPAMLFFVKGEASVGLGDDVQEAQAGTWVHMPASLKHSIKAKTPLVMLLVLLK